MFLKRTPYATSGAWPVPVWDNGQAAFRTGRLPTCHSHQVGSGMARETVTQGDRECIPIRGSEKSECVQARSSLPSKTW